MPKRIKSSECECTDCGGQLVPYVVARDSDIVRGWPGGPPYDLICDECDIGYAIEEAEADEQYDEERTELVTGMMNKALARLRKGGVS